MCFDWNSYLTKFVKVMPTDYKRVLLERKAKGKQLPNALVGAEVSIAKKNAAHAM